MALATAPAAFLAAFAVSTAASPIESGMRTRRLVSAAEGEIDEEEAIDRALKRKGLNPQPTGAPNYLPTPAPLPTPLRACVDTDFGASVGNEWTCAVFNEYPTGCGFYDGSDFSCSVMCCGCDGGALAVQFPEGGYTFVAQGAAGPERWKSDYMGQGVEACFDAVMAEAECAKDYFSYASRGDKNCSCKTVGTLSVRSDDAVDYYNLQGDIIWGAVCPATHPYAYHNNNAYCCSSAQEKVGSGGAACDGSALHADGVQSMCCKGDHVRCSELPCKSVYYTALTGACRTATGGHGTSTWSNKNLEDCQAACSDLSDCVAFEVSAL